MFSEKELTDTYESVKKNAEILTWNNAVDRDDLLHKTYENILKNRDKFPGGNLGGWINEKMKWLHLTELELEKLKRIKFINQDSDETLKEEDCKAAEDYRAGEGSIVEEGYRTGEESKKRIYSTLQKMDKKCQDILLLLGREYPYKEIAKQLSIPIGTVMSRLSRCRSQFKKLYV